MRLLLVSSLLCLALTSVASADRAATKGEKHAIVKAAKRSKQTKGFGCFTMDHVRVSTAGPWAGGTLRACEDENAAIFGLFSKRDGRWRMRATGNGAVGCDIAPEKVQRDLDLGCS